MIANLLLASTALFSYINSPVATMREQPKNESEVVSQAYFSEEIRILEEAQEWLKIETVADHYQGWIPKKAICQRPQAFLAGPTTTLAKVNRCAAHLYHVSDTVYGPLLTLPFDSQVEVLDPTQSENVRWVKVALPDSTEGYIQRGDITLDHTPLNCDQMCALSLQFLGLPYTWGGRSSFGYDCSGFVQMLYRQRGIYTPRDSKDQLAWEGFTPISIDQLMPGDLIFWGLAEDKIRHVGMYLGEDRFIHATVAENAPYIHISRLSDPTWNGSGLFTYCAARTLKGAAL